MLNIKTVTVVGANGTMGTNVSAIFASFGNAKVYMVSRSVEKSRDAALKACKTVRADSILRNLIPADYSMLASCVSDSDLVFESVAETLDLKVQMHSLIAESLKPEAIACTGSSGLSITRLAECYPIESRGRFFGVHMFNPPYQLTLCELTKSSYSDNSLCAELKTYLSNVLHRTVAESKDCPAFIGNRIGFCFMNTALQYAERYKDNGGVDYIDAVLGPFTGRAMAPLVTVDFVGLDVHKAIVDNVYQSTEDYARNAFILPAYVQNLIDRGKLGKKCGEGLYKTIRNESGEKRILVYDINTGEYRDEIDYAFPFALEMKSLIREGNYDDAIRVLLTNHSQEAQIALRFLLDYIVYSLYIAQTVGYEPGVADDVMATGFTWCPPFALMEAFSHVCEVGSLLETYYSAESLSSIGVRHYIESPIKSQYDYRIFFKAR